MCESPLQILTIVWIISHCNWRVDICFNRVNTWLNSINGDGTLFGLHVFSSLNSPTLRVSSFPFAFSFCCTLLFINETVDTLSQINRTDVSCFGSISFISALARFLIGVQHPVVLLLCIHGCQKHILGNFQGNIPSWDIQNTALASWQWHIDQKHSCYWRFDSSRSYDYHLSANGQCSLLLSSLFVFAAKFDLFVKCLSWFELLRSSLLRSSRYIEKPSRTKAILASHFQNFRRSGQPSSLSCP